MLFIWKKHVGTLHHLRVSDIDHGPFYAVFLQNTPILSHTSPGRCPELVCIAPLQRRDCSRVRWPRFSQLAPRPHPSRQWLRIRFDESCHPLKRRSEARDYAAFLQNAGFFFRVDSQGLHPGLVCNAPTGHGIGNVVAGLAPTEPRRHVVTRCPLRHGSGTGNDIIPFAPTGQRIPAQGIRPGNPVRENWCVLKEHRIGRAGKESAMRCSVSCFLFPVQD